MGILSLHRNLLSQLKHLSSSSPSNLWFIRTISSLSSPPGDLKSNNNNKLMLLTQHFHNESSGIGQNSLLSLTHFPPYNYSLISAHNSNSWKDHHNLGNNPFSGFGCKYILADSCNELMLFKLYNMDTPFSRWQGDYLLWNPNIDKFKILPPPGPAFTNIHGFGYDSQSNDYKVLRFPLYGCMYDDSGVDIDQKVELYSLKTDSWKEIAFAYSRCSVPVQKPSVHVNGVYYWESILSWSAIILSFDFVTEKFSSAPYIPRPPKFDDLNERVFVDDFVLVEFDGSLAALVHSELGNVEKTFSFEVWGWDGELWIEKMPRIAIDVPGGVVKVVGFFQDDKLFLQGFDKGELMLFDLAKKKMENLGIRADPEKVNIFPFNVGSSIPLMAGK